MSSFLRRAAKAVAFLSVAKPWKHRVHIPRRPLPPRGHLALVRAHPGLRDLDAALAASSDALFLDAAHALAAGAIRAPTITSKLLRAYDGTKGLPLNIGAAAESMGGPGAALQRRIHLAILRAREGRFDEALADLVRLVGDSPGDPHPRLATAAMCHLHGHPRAAHEWFRSVPLDTGIRRWSYEVAIVLAMPGSSPAPPEQGVDGNVMCLATRLAEVNLLASLERGEWSMLEKMLVSVTLHALRRFASKYSNTPCAPVKRSMVAGAGGRTITGNFMLVECSQAILAAVLRARPLCGARLQVVRSVAERALADAKAKGETRPAVDVNLVLAFLAARDGHFDEALRRYEAAVREDPHDSRPYELADMLCSICGFAKGREAWRRSREKLRRATNGHAALPVLRDQLAVAAALGHGNLTASDNRHRGHVSLAAGREVDVWLAAAPLHMGLNTFDSLTIRMLRVGLQRWMGNAMD